MSFEVSFPQAQVLHRYFEKDKATKGLCKSHQKVIETVAEAFALKQMSTGDISANVYEALYLKGQEISDSKEYYTVVTKISDVLVEIAKLQIPGYAKTSRFAKL